MHGDTTRTAHTGLPLIVRGCTGCGRTTNEGIYMVLPGVGDRFVLGRDDFLPRVQGC
jgi:hypothetical protein